MTARLSQYKFTLMRTPQTTAKISPRTLQGVRLIVEATNEKQYVVFERLVEAELKRLGLKMPRAPASAKRVSERPPARNDDE